MKNKKRYLVLASVGAVALLLGGTGVAYAQRGEPPWSGESFGGSTPFAAAGVVGGLGQGGPLMGDSRPGGPMRGEAASGLVQITAELAGLTREEVVNALRGGETLAEIASANGVDPEAIVGAAIEEAESRLAEAVEEGRLGQEEADEVLDRMAETLPDRLEEPWEPHGPAGGFFGKLGEGFWTAYDAVAEALGLEADELFIKLHDEGMTVPEVADEQGVDMSGVHDALEATRIEARKQMIEKAVEYGRMSSEQAEWMIEGLDQGFVPRGRRLFGAPRLSAGAGGCRGREGR